MSHPNDELVRQAEERILKDCRPINPWKKVIPLQADERDPLAFVMCLRCQSRFTPYDDDPEPYRVAQLATETNPFECPKCNKNMDFGQALLAMRQGKRVRREDWSEGSYLIIDNEDREFIFQSGDCDDCRWSWEVSDDFFSDIIATDWEVVK